MNTSTVELAGHVPASTPRPRSRLKLSWVTVVVAALFIAYVDGFWVTSLQGTIGAVERSQPPFHRWWVDSTMMLPLLVLGVAAALLLTRRWFGRGRRELVTLSAAALAIIAITTLISIAEVTASSIYDYHLQARDLATSHLTHVHEPIVPAGSTTLGNPGGCNGLCSARHETLALHVHAVTYISMMLLITNIALVLWVLALRGGRLWKRHLPPEEPNDDHPVTATALA